MRLRRFTAATMQQALRQVKTALGPDAVILETSDAGGQITVTAAVDAADATPTLRPGGSPGDQELASEVRQLLGVVRALLETRRREATLAEDPEVRRLHRALLLQGVDGVIAAALVRDTAERVERGTPFAHALAGTLAVAGSPAEGARVQLFIGPPGDGKTTTIAKLAAQARRAGRRVALVGTDTYRVGALAELETYGRAMGIPVAAAADPAGLGRALAAAGDADLVLVDTAGAAPAPGAALDELAALADAAGPEATRLVVTSAATAGRAAAETWDAYAPLRPAACVLTKCDLAPGGPVLGVLWRRGVPVIHVAAGRRIPDDLEPATPDRLARCLLAA
jgi:flagellar biosynthesis protein FlhF